MKDLMFKKLIIIKNLTTFMKLIKLSKLNILRKTNYLFNKLFFNYFFNFF